MKSLFSSFAPLALLISQLNSMSALAHIQIYPLPTPEEIATNHLICIDGSNRIDLKKENDGYLATWYHTETVDESAFQNIELRLKDIAEGKRLMGIRILFERCAERIKDQPLFNFCTGAKELEVSFFERHNNENHLSAWKKMPIEYAKLTTQMVQTVSNNFETVALSKPNLMPILSIQFLPEGFLPQVSNVSNIIVKTFPAPCVGN